LVIECGTRHEELAFSLTVFHFHDQAKKQGCRFKRSVSVLPVFHIPSQCTHSLHHLLQFCIYLLLLIFTDLVVDVVCGPDYDLFIRSKHVAFYVIKIRCA